MELGLLRFNIAHNSDLGHRRGASRDICAKTVDWTEPATARAARGEEAEPIGLIVGAEISYDSELHGPFIETLLSLTARGPTQGREDAVCTVLLAVPHRDEDRALIQAATARGFQAELAKLCAPTPEHSSEIGIYRLTPPQAVR